MTDDYIFQVLSSNRSLFEEFIKEMHINYEVKLGADFNTYFMLYDMTKEQHEIVYCNALIIKHENGFEISFLE